jgi:hypothetical protein
MFGARVQGSKIDKFLRHLEQQRKIQPKINPGRNQNAAYKNSTPSPKLIKYSSFPMPFGLYCRVGDVT